MKNKENLEEVKDINYWKNNCEENYITTPISVLRYISELEKQQERSYSEAIEFGKWLDENMQQREYYPMNAMTMEELFEQFKKK